MRRFECKIALVTGGTKGIGRAIALRLAGEGCDVAVNFLKNRENANQVVGELESRGVNAVAGGITDTESLGYFPSREQLIEHARRFTPSGRLTRPEDIAAAVAFLLSDDAAWIVGQTIVVDGGLSLI